MNLYELSAERSVILTAIEDAGGEISADLEAALDALDTDIERRVEFRCQLLREWETDTVKLTAELDRLKAALRTKENAIARMEERTLAALKTAGIDKLKAGTFVVTVAKKGGKPVIRWTRTVEECPPEFVKETVPEKYVDMALVHEVFKLNGGEKGGGTLPDGFTVERGVRLQIR